MKRQLVLTVSAVVLAMSGGLFLMAGERVAQAAPPDKIMSNQSWDENQTGTARFTVLSAFGGAAVRDNNTGLVWEQAPEATQLTWAAAAKKCINKAVGGTVLAAALGGGIKECARSLITADRCPGEHLYRCSIGLSLLVGDDGCRGPPKRVGRAL